MTPVEIFYAVFAPCFLASFPVGWWLGRWSCRRYDKAHPWPPERRPNR